MNRVRFGELLKRITPLNQQDVEDILEEQKSSGLRFGEIAMSWGLCEPEHVWRAWCEQTGNRIERIDLDRVGVDATAISVLPRESAIALQAIPIRAFDQLVVIALADPSQQLAIRSAVNTPDREIKFVTADPRDLDWAIQTYYSPLAMSA